jgi:hypothetical protein
MHAKLWSKSAGKRSPDRTRILKKWCEKAWIGFKYLTQCRGQWQALLNMIKLQVA